MFKMQLLCKCSSSGLAHWPKKGAVNLLMWSVFANKPIQSLLGIHKLVGGSCPLGS